jgi:hypothetical protein
MIADPVVVCCGVCADADDGAAAVMASPAPASRASRRLMGEWDMFVSFCHLLVDAGFLDSIKNGDLSPCSRNYHCFPALALVILSSASLTVKLAAFARGGNSSKLFR